MLSFSSCGRIIAEYPTGIPHPAELNMTAQVTIHCKKVTEKVNLNYAQEG